MPDFEKMKEAINGRGQFTQYNGIRVTDLAEGRCECQVTLTEKGCNPHGIAHGGLLFSMCDTAAGIAATTLDRSVVSRTAEMHFLRPAVGGVITARGRVVSAGAHMAYCTAEVFDEKGELLASAGFEMFYLQKPVVPRETADSSVPG